MQIALRFHDLSLFRRNIDKALDLLHLPPLPSVSHTGTLVETATLAQAVQAKPTRAGKSEDISYVDWERRNKFLLLEGLFALSTRNFALASHLLHDALATYSSPEILSMDTLVLYYACAALLADDRATLHTRCLQHPDVVASLAT